MIRRLIIPLVGVEHVSILRQMKRRLKVHGLRTFSRSGVLASLYYTIVSRSFRREQQAVLHGRLQHEEDNLSNERSEYRLRRNVHRLEKGLIMRPRRSIFATEYIEDTVRCFAERMNTIDGTTDSVAGMEKGGESKTRLRDVEDMRWVRDVLHAYFSVVGSHPAIERARARFQSVDSALREEGPRLAPYQRELSDAPPVAYEELLQLAVRRRSTRWFRAKAVPRKLLDRAILVAAQSPSACNRQPFQFRIFDDPQLASQVALMPLGTRGFEHNFPVMVAVVGRLRAYFDEKDRHVIYIDGGLAAMSFILALETLGLSSCCVNWPDVEPQETEMARLLGLEADERVVMLIAVGWPDTTAMVPASGKRGLETLRSYNVAR